MTLRNEVRNPEAAPNALGQAIGALGDEWTLLLLRAALGGATRYGEFKAGLAISDAVLTNRLGRLVELGLLTRRIYQQTPLRAAYDLTPAGAATWPILLGIWDWERHWVPDRADELPSMRHRRCGAAFVPVLACAACGDAVGLADLGASWGDDGGWARSVAPGRTRRRAQTGRDDREAGLFAETMTILGNRHSCALLAAALLGARRFGEFQTRLGIPAAVLSQRLDEFCRVGVFATEADARRSDRHTYRLTAKGLAFAPVILCAQDWAQRRLVPAAAGGGPGSAIRLTHHACGHRFHPRWHCGTCGTALTGADVDVVPPSG